MQASARTHTTPCEALGLVLAHRVLAGVLLSLVLAGDGRAVSYARTYNPPWEQPDSRGRAGALLVCATPVAAGRVSSASPGAAGERGAAPLSTHLGPLSHLPHFVRSGGRGWLKGEG